MTDDKPPKSEAQLRIEKEILEDRRRRAAAEEPLKAMLRRKRAELAQRRGDGQWPVDARTGDRAEIDPEDVQASTDELSRELTDEEIERWKQEAEAAPSGFGNVDENLMAARRVERDRAQAEKRKVVGERWTESLVEARIDEAFRVLTRVKVGNLGPRMFGNGMPTPVREMSDLVAQAGNKSLRKAMKRLLRDEGPPSQDEVARMEDTLGWALKYLRDQNPDMALFLNLGGMWRAWRAPIVKKCAEIGVHRQVFYRDRKAAVRAIVEGLIKDGRAPT